MFGFLLFLLILGGGAMIVKAIFGAIYGTSSMSEIAREKEVRRRARAIEAGSIDGRINAEALRRVYGD